MKENNNDDDDDDDDDHLPCPVDKKTGSDEVEQAEQCQAHHRCNSNWWKAHNDAAIDKDDSYDRDEADDIGFDDDDVVDCVLTSHPGILVTNVLFTEKIIACVAKPGGRVVQL